MKTAHTFLAILAELLTASSDVKELVIAGTYWQNTWNWTTHRIKQSWIFGV